MSQVVIKKGGKLSLLRDAQSSCGRERRVSAYQIGVTGQVKFDESF